MELIADAAAVRQCLAYLDHQGIDARLLAIDGLRAALQTTAGPLPISASIIVELMETAAEVTHRPDFGVRFVEWLNPRGFGPLSLLADHCSTYAESFRLVQRFIDISNNAVSYDEKREGDDVALLVSVHPSLRPRAKQFLEGLVALMARNARAMLGERWNPVRIEFGHASPQSIATQRRFFRCPAEYDSDRYALIVPASDFARRVARRKEEMLRFLEGHLTTQRAQWPSDLGGQVENLIASQIAGGGAEVTHVAELLAMSARTLQRKLAEQNTSFGERLAFVRCQIVREHLSRDPAPTLARLAHMLGFSDPSVACRFVKTHFGKSTAHLVTHPQAARTAAHA